MGYTRGVYLDRRKSGRRKKTFIITKNDKLPSAWTKITFVTSCFNSNPFLRTFKVWPVRSDFGWGKRGRMAVNSAPPLPSHLAICSPAKGPGLFRQAPVPAESSILKLKFRVNFLFSTDSETNYLYSALVIPFPCIQRELQHRLLCGCCHSTCVLLL